MFGPFIEANDLIFASNFIKTISILSSIATASHNVDGTAEAAPCSIYVVELKIDKKGF